MSFTFLLGRCPGLVLGGAVEVRLHHAPEGNDIDQCAQQDPQARRAALSLRREAEHVGQEFRVVGEAPHVLTILAASASGSARILFSARHTSTAVNSCSIVGSGPSGASGWDLSYRRNAH